MSNLDKARMIFEQEQAKMYELSKLKFPGLQIEMAAAKLVHVLNALSPEDRATLMAEQTAKFVKEA